MVIVHFKVVLFVDRLHIQSPQLRQIYLHFCHPLHPSASGYERYWLWMDLASVHYANDILVLLQQQSICYIP